eukprot:a175122_138.p1 GENE.a175122_138~~a175122_138.p1  ORF type:complete len:525 (-),score=170.84 a175122_138:37-1569(-)
MSSLSVSIPDDHALTVVGAAAAGASVIDASSAVATSAPSYYKRQLPTHLVPFSSSEGKQIFRDALLDGTMDAYFCLSEQFATQSEPAFCALASLSMSLNALGVDPHRVWKGPWRWFSEEMLDCCKPLEIVKQVGVTLDEFVCIAKCNGGLIERFARGDESPSRFSLELFRAAVISAAQTPSDKSVLIVSYDRQVLGQTGSGHFSPIGGYSRAHDMVLVLDVARFKYPPHWVPTATLFEAMRTLDPTTGRARGFVVLAASASPPFSALVRISHPSAAVEGLRRLAAAIEDFINAHPRSRTDDFARALIKTSTGLANDIGQSFAFFSEAATMTLSPRPPTPSGSIATASGAFASPLAFSGHTHHMSRKHFALCGLILAQLRELLEAQEELSEALHEAPPALVLTSVDGQELRVTAEDVMFLLLLAFPVQCGMLSATAQAKLRPVQAVTLPAELGVEVRAIQFKLKELCSVHCADLGGCSDSGCQCACDSCNGAASAAADGPNGASNAQAVKQ